MLNIRGFICVLFLLLIPVGGIAQSLQLADSLRVKGERFQDGGNFQEAEFYYSEALNLYKTHHDTASWLVTGIYYAEVLSYQSEMDEAIELFNQIKSTSHPANNDSLNARIESDLGWIYKQQGNLTKSLQHLQKGLTYARKANDSLMIGVSLNNLAGTYSRQNNTQQALEYYKKTLSLFEDLNNQRSQAYALSNIGTIYRDLFLFEKALEYYSQSLQIAKQLNNVNLLAYTYDRIGRLQQDIGNYDQALTEMQKSLKYRRQANNLQEVASILNTIGTLYDELGDNKKSLEYYRQSLTIWQKVSNPAQLAVVNKNIGGSLWAQGNHKEATFYYERALALKKETDDPRAIATSLIDLAKVETTQASYLDAYNYLRNARAIADSSDDIHLLKQVAQQFGHLSYAQNRIGDAIKHYETALKHGGTMPQKTRITPLKGLAKAYNTLDSDSALIYARRAIDLIEQGRTQTGPLSELKAGYFKQHSDFYIDFSAWIIKYENDISEAYRLTEAAKARTLTDELAQAARRVDESLPEQERLNRAQKLAEISGLYAQFDTTSDGSKGEALKAQIRDKELAYASFENELQQQYPQYKYLESPAPVALQEVQQMCNEETAILEYAVSEDQLLIFYITNEQAAAKRIPVAEDSSKSMPVLADQVNQFREAILAQAPEDSIHKLSAPIYEQLIAPFQSKLRAKQNILVVPDGFLAYLPFEALSINNNYLVSQHDIKYAPSMTGFSFIPKPRYQIGESILTIANSDQYASLDQAAMLPTVNLEVESIAKLFSNVTMLSDQSITEENVKKQMQETHSIIHIAAHSVIDEQKASLSGVLLGKGGAQNGVGNDGRLQNAEIYRLNIPSDMVVLSACKSGIGQLVNGEGMLGLQRAFFNAGTSAVVVSLWDVYDRSTTHFMQLFYKSLMEAPDNRTWRDSWQSMMRWIGWDQSEPYGYTASSMRKAKLAMLDHPKYHHPVYWAPFIVVGR